MLIDDGTTTVGFGDLCAAVGAGTAAIVEHLAVAGPAAPVPTTPDWRLGDLVRHLGRVHRWASYIVTNGVTARDQIPSGIGQPLPADEQLGEWLTQGADEVVQAITDAPADLDAMVLFGQSPSARLFWARRQAHETTVHAVDALAARLERLPLAKEADIDPALAVDGIDELVTGLVTSERSQLRAQRRFTALILPNDADQSWSVTLSDQPPVTVRGGIPGGDPEAVLTGTAAALYLGLWNRGDEIAATGEPELLGVWRDKVRI